MTRLLLTALPALLASGCPETTEEPPAVDMLARRRAACAALSQTWCSTSSVCRTKSFESEYGSIQNCVERRTLLCEKTLFGVGSTLTAKDVQGCAEAELEYSSCEDFLRRESTRSSACTKNGTLQPGEQCVTGAQCESGGCAPTSSACGRCRKLRGVAEQCLDDGECESGLVCAELRCVKPKALGGECGPTAPCFADLVCREGTCARRLGPDEPCNPLERGDCELWPIELACSSQSNRCVPVALQPIGQPCGDLDDGSVALCEPGSACQVGAPYKKGFCVPVTADGNSCSVLPNTGEEQQHYPFGGPCRPPAVCFQGVCKVLAAVACDVGPPP